MKITANYIGIIEMNTFEVKEKYKRHELSDGSTIDLPLKSSLTINEFLDRINKQKITIKGL